MSDDHKLGLLGLNESSDVVQSILDDNRLGSKLGLGKLALGGGLNIMMSPIKFIKSTSDQI